MNEWKDAERADGFSSVSQKKKTNVIVTTPQQQQQQVRLAMMTEPNISVKITQQRREEENERPESFIRKNIFRSFFPFIGG